MSDMLTQVFNATGIGDLRAVIIDGEPWFLGTDIGECLGYANPRRGYLDHTREKYRKPLKYKDSPESGRAVFWKENDFSDKVFVSEAGLYQMIFESENEAAIPFQDWIFEEVLPSIRRRGGYILNQESLSEGELEEIYSSIEELSAKVRFLQKRRHEILKVNRELSTKNAYFKKEIAAWKDYADTLIEMYEVLEKENRKLMRTYREPVMKAPEKRYSTTIDNFGRVISIMVD